MSSIQTDFLVIGSGVAGLSFALKAASLGRVLILTKATRDESNTKYAQGGIAGVFADNDTFEHHIQDTLIAGDGLCRESVVRMVVENGPERIKELMDYGAQFDRKADGTLSLGKEGGHSAHRILHSRDATGFEIERALLDAVKAHPNIIISEHFFTIDLLTQHHLGMYVNRGYPDVACFGVYALDLKDRKIHTILSRVTVLASGGAGNVYLHTTNPAVATGDGIAMVYRAMGRISNMEFMQFHPTALYDPTGSRPAFLITEALRGKGAVLRTPYDKVEFMHRYDSRLSLAPRDIVARAIDSEMKLSGMPYVYLDATHLPAHEIREEFPTIYEHCLSKGIDITRELIPVVPACHYTCGGVAVDTHGRTSIRNLYACGEVTCTGLHGANRLASNSLLEGIVYADTIFQNIKSNFHETTFQEGIPAWDDQSTERTEEWVLVSHNLKELQTLMSNYVGIVRSDLRLDRAMRRLDLMYHETEEFYRRTRISPELCELRNLITCAYLIVKCARIRKESRGLHYTTDYNFKLEKAFDTIL